MLINLKKKLETVFADSCGKLFWDVNDQSAKANTYQRHIKCSFLYLQLFNSTLIAHRMKIEFLQGETVRPLLHFVIGHITK